MFMGEGGEVMKCIRKLTSSHWERPNKSECHPEFSGCFLLLISLPSELSQADLMNSSTPRAALVFITICVTFYGFLELWPSTSSHQPSHIFGFTHTPTPTHLHSDADMWPFIKLWNQTKNLEKKKSQTLSQLQEGKRDCQKNAAQEFLHWFPPALFCPASKQM